MSQLTLAWAVNQSRRVFKAKKKQVHPEDVSSAGTDGGGSPYVRRLTDGSEEPRNDEESNATAEHRVPRRAHGVDGVRPGRIQDKGGGETTHAPTAGGGPEQPTAWVPGLRPSSHIIPREQPGKLTGKLHRERRGEQELNAVAGVQNADAPAGDVHTVAVTTDRAGRAGGYTGKHGGAPGRQHGV